VPSETSISTLLGLTPAESRIAAGLAKGQSVSEYAATVGITENTARSTLKHVFAKTGTRSQADLVRLITQSIPSTPY
jgi:DNA-binding CsgD family transcriptional regulator